MPTNTNEYMREYRKLNGSPAKKLERNRALFLLTATGVCVCAKCGRAPTSPEETTEGFIFHHLDPATKKFHVGGNMSGRTRAMLEAEAAKCVILCAVCHRVHRNQGYTLAPDQALLR